MRILKLSTHTSLIFATLVWLLTVLAGLLWAWINQNQVGILIPYVTAASIPAFAALFMGPILHKEWAQLIVIFSWIALAIAACVGVAFFPMAILFLCAPAAAFLFHNEKVIESMALSALLASMIYYTQQNGILPETLLTPDSKEWAKTTALIACFVMIITVMIISSYQADERNQQRAILQQGAIDPVYRSMTDVAPAAGFVEKLPAAILHIDSSGVPLYMNSHAKALLRVTASDEASEGGDIAIKPSTLADILDFDLSAHVAFKDLIAVMRKQKNQQSAIVNIIDIEGQEQYYDVTATPMAGNSYMLYMANITDQKIQLNRLQKSAENAQEESADKTLFFAGVSHELRTPLNAIIGFSDMMRTRLFGPLPGKYAEYADLIHDSGQHMLDLIGDVLDLSKIEAGKYDLQYGQFDVADVIRSTLKMVQPIADVAEVLVETDISDHQDYILQADRRAIRQVLLNLLSNAIKFSPKGEKVLVSANILDDRLTVIIQDNGAGMSADELDIIGTPFTQMGSAQFSRERGSGLGLSLVKSLVDLHGGDVEFSSEIDVGTVVTIYIPLTPPLEAVSDI